MNSKRVGILGLGHYLPERIVQNDYFLKTLNLDTSDDWIKTRTGIQTRHIRSANEMTSDLPVNAAKKALEDAQLAAEDCDFIICATSTPDFQGFPSTACVIQQKLGCRTGIFCVDISAACSGFVVSLSMGYARICAGMGRYGLIIGAEAFSNIVDWSDRKTCVLFGDGAGAAVIGPVGSGGFIQFDEGANGAFADILKVSSKLNTLTIDQVDISEPRSVIDMDGRLVFKQGVQAIDACLSTIRQSFAVDLDELDYIILHQANLRMIESIASRYGWSESKILHNIDQVGNTSAASIPIVMSQFRSLFTLGIRVALIGFGAGFTWASTVLEWGEKE